MTATTEETFTVELPVEAAYDQLVSFQKASKAFTKADEEDDADGRLEAANAAVNSCIDLINEVVTGEVSEKLHARLEKEHPELVDEAPAVDLDDLMRALGLLEA